MQLRYQLRLRVSIASTLAIWGNLLRLIRKSLLWLIVALPLAMLLPVSGYFYMGFAPCSSCHQDTSFVQATQMSAHSAVDCVDCHATGGAVGRADFGVRHLVNVLPFGPDVSRDLTAIDDQTCLECHQTVMDGTVEADGVNVNHAYCSTANPCTDCHSTVAHGREISWIRTYDMETCLSCHVDVGSVDCATCHVGRLAEDRITTGTFAITHGPQWKETHGMGDSSTCTACHTAAACQTCHGAGVPHEARFLSVHAEYAKDPEQLCIDCHDQRFCDDCHGLAMPHPNQFVRAHAQYAEQDEELCRRCHLQPDCTICHETHVHPGGAIDSLPGGGETR